VKCEMVLEPLYSEQSSPRDLIDFLCDAGFELVGVESGQVRPSGCGVWIDGTLCREPVESGHHYVAVGDMRTIILADVGVLRSCPRSWCMTTTTATAH
jgi:hypothetical protein